MASWLATGEGASQGLEEVLHRMMMEHAQQQQLTEQGRHNLASEGLEGRRIDEQSADRRLREQERSDAQGALNKNRDEANVLRRVALRPIGADVTPEEKAGEIAHGIPIGNYNFTPANMGMDTMKGSVGPTPDTLRWKGTQDQITRAAAAGKHGEDKGTIHDTPQGLARLFSDGTTEPVLDENGKRVQGFHQPPIQLVQSGEGYSRVDRSTGATSPVLGPDKKPLPLAITSQTRAMSEGARMLEPHIQQQRAMAEELDKQGLFGPVMSRVRQALQKAGTIDEFAAMIGEDPEINRDRLSGDFATSLGLLATGAGRVHGGARGGGSPQMYQHFKSMLQDASTLQMFEGRLDAIDKYMTGYAAGPGGGAAPGAAPPAAGDIIRYNMQGQVIK